MLDTLTPAPRDASSRWYRATQDATLAFADAHREPWARDDLEFVIEMTDVESDEDIAYALGRSLASIWAITHRIRRDGAIIVRAEFDAAHRSTESSRVANAPTYDFVTTFPPGYRD